MRHMFFLSFYSFCFVISLYNTFDAEDEEFEELTFLVPFELFREKLEELLSDELETWFGGSNELFDSDVLLLMPGWSECRCWIGVVLGVDFEPGVGP